MLLSKKQIISLLVSTLCVMPAFSSGYHFGTQSVSEQSTANASSAEASDASTLFYNAAGLTKLSGTHFSVNTNFIAPSVKYENAQASYFSINPESITGKTNGKLTEDLVIAPHLYASHQLDDKVTLGLGVYIPFASGTEYQRDSVLRYNVNKTKLTSVDINPTVAFKINDNHSLAVGLTAQYSKAEFRQYANFAPLVSAAVSKKMGKPVPMPNGAKDGFADVEGDDWGFGYTLGYLWDVNDNVRLGASYRSKVEHNLEGRAKWQSDDSMVEAIIPHAGYLADEPASVKITTPESLSLHGMVKLDEKWTAFGDVTLTRHSRFNKVSIDYGTDKTVTNAANPKLVVDKSNNTTLKPNWKDTVKVGIGAAYQYDDNLQLRGGVAFDESPVRSPEERLTTMPDNDRIWLSVGAKYKINDNSSLNVGYSYIHIKNSKVDTNGYCGSNVPVGSEAKNCVSSRTKGSADYKSNAHILGVQYNYNF